MSVTIVSAADLGTFMDDIVNLYVLGIGNATAGCGLGDATGAFGASLAASNLKSDLLSMTSTDFIVQIAAATKRLFDNLDGKKILARGYAAPVLSLIESHIRAAGVDATVTSLETYLKYLNVGSGGTWACLMPYQWRDLYYKWKNAYPAVYNVYFEILQGSTYPNGLRKLVIGTGQTAGTDVDYTKYCGGFPYLNVASRTGTDVVTVTGTAYDPVAKAISTGKTWTCTVNNTGQFVLNVGTAPANSLIVAVTNISAGASLSAGTMYVEAHRPTSRRLIS